MAETMPIERLGSHLTRGLSYRQARVLQTITGTWAIKAPGGLGGQSVSDYRVTVLLLRCWINWH
jgi:hypothetical protein